MNLPGCRLEKRSSEAFLTMMARATDGQVFPRGKTAYPATCHAKSHPVDLCLLNGDHIYFKSYNVLEKRSLCAVTYWATVNACVNVSMTRLAV